jgi:epoxyqueuosine reductase
VPDPTHTAREILGLCRDQGFTLAGITPATPASRPQFISDWFAAGKHGTMDWLTEHLHARLDVRTLIPGIRNIRSVIVVADLYATRNDPADPPLPPAHARIARYARGRDYHPTMKRKLHDIADILRDRYPGNKFRSFVDSAPVLEREHAARAGLGWIGKHTLLIHPRLGSYLALGGIATSLALEAPPELAITDACGTCTRCIDACPTNAISPYSVDASRCISYLTIERRQTIPTHFHAPISTWIYGCDVCQEVCPHNSPRDPSIDVGSPRADYAQRRHAFSILDILDWMESDRRSAFSTSPMKRATLDMMKRNALIVAGNLLAENKLEPDHAAALHARIRALAGDPLEPDLVRQTAAQVLARQPIA